MKFKKIILGMKIIIVSIKINLLTIQLKKKKRLYEIFLLWLFNLMINTILIFYHIKLGWLKLKLWYFKKTHEGYD